MNEYTFPQQFPVTCHTDYVGNGSTFVVINGRQFDGVDFIADAIDRGASKIVVQHDCMLSEQLEEKIAANNIAVERVNDTRLALAELSAHALGNPAGQLKIIGITGTKGKTTTAFLVEHVLRAADCKTALISTVGNKIGGYALPKNLTTPQPDYLHMFFSESVRLGVEMVVMEVSAQALSLQRLQGIQFDGIIFTNFSQEHAEFYDSQEAYFKAKCQIFKHLKPGAPCVVNADDAWYAHLLEPTHAVQGLIDFSLQHKNVTVAGIVEKNSFQEGLVVRLSGSNGTYTVATPSLVGLFNAYNVGMAAALASALGVVPDALCAAFSSFDSVPGRMQRYRLVNSALAIIDHAHTPSSFEAVLLTLRQVTDNIIVVFGAGGNRDNIKRPEMGRIATRYADTVILTTDNPRNENPEDIIRDIMLGIPEEEMGKLLVILDRESAIKKAYQLSSSKTVIALLGKGPDEYQEVHGVRTPFSERAVLALLS